MIQPASLLESSQSGIMPGSSAGQKNAPICTSTCAAQTTATSLAGERRECGGGDGHDRETLNRAL